MNGTILSVMQRNAVAEMIHTGMRGRLPESDLETDQAEQVADHVADYISSKAGWTAPDDATVNLSLDEARELLESVIGVRQAMATVADSLIGNYAMRTRLQCAREQLAAVVHALQWSTVIDSLSLTTTGEGMDRDQRCS